MAHNLVLFKIEGSDKINAINIRTYFCPWEELSRILTRHTNRPDDFPVFAKTTTEELDLLFPDRGECAIVQEIIPPVGG